MSRPSRCQRSNVRTAKEWRLCRARHSRHSFALNALLTCPEGRDNVGRHLLALSTYMGHAKFSDTYWYLESTPQLMRDIAEACQGFLQGGVQ